MISGTTALQPISQRPRVFRADESLLSSVTSCISSREMRASFCLNNVLYGLAVHDRQDSDKNPFKAWWTFSDLASSAIQHRLCNLADTNVLLAPRSKLTLR